MGSDFAKDILARQKEAQERAELVHMIPVSVSLPSIVEGSICSYKCQMPGRLIGISLDTEGLKDELTLVSSLSRNGSTLDLVRQIILKPGANNIGDYDVLARDRLDFSVEGLGTSGLTLIYFKYEYRA